MVLSKINSYCTHFFFVSSIKTKLLKSMSIIISERELMELTSFSKVSFKNFFFLKRSDSLYLIRKELYFWHILDLKRINFKYYNYIYFYYSRLWDFSKNKDSFYLDAVDIRKYHRRAHIDFVHRNYSFYKSISKNKKNFYLLNFKKKFVRRSKLKEYKKYLERFTFKQYDLMRLFFELRYLNRHYFLRLNRVRRYIKIFINKRGFFTLKLMKFYRRRIAALRYTKSR